LSPMADVTIIEEPEEENGDVLAEAAVASAAIAGHADAQAERAVEWTGEVADEVEAVEAVATSAAVEAASKPGRHEVEELVELKIEDAFARVADLLAERLTPAPAPEPAPAPAKDAAPPSVKKQRKRRSFAERYLGIGDDGDE